MFQDGGEKEDYNADTEIPLKVFPHIKMTLGEIFDILLVTVIEQELQAFYFRV